MHFQIDYCGMLLPFTVDDKQVGFMYYQCLLRVALLVFWCYNCVIYICLSFCSKLKGVLVLRSAGGEPFTGFAPIIIKLINYML